MRNTDNVLFSIKKPGKTNPCLLLFLVTVLAWLYPGSADAQPVIKSNYTHMHYTPYQGLPQMQISGLFQDSKGFLWVGTNEGLARFDGSKFQIFTHAGKYPLNRITRIFEFRNRYFFINFKEIYTGVGTNLDSLQVINYPRGYLKFSPQYRNEAYFNPRSNELLIPNFLDSPEDNTYKHLWFNMKTGKFRPVRLIDEFIKYYHYNQTDSTHYYITHKNYYTFRNNRFSEHALPEEVEAAVAFNEKLTIVTKNGIRQYIMRNGSLADPVEPLNRPPGHIQDVFIFENELFISLSAGKLFRIRDGQLEKIAELNMNNSSLVDNDGNLWIGTDTGLYNFFRFLFTEFKTDISPAGDMFWSAFKDRNENLWIGSFGNGFYKKKGERLEKLLGEHIKPPPAGDQSLFPYFSSVTDNAGDLYTTIAGNVLAFKKSGVYSYPTTTGLFLYNEEESGKVYVAGVGSLDVLDKKTGHVASFRNESLSNLLCMAPLGNGLYYCGSNRGQYLFNGKKLIPLNYPARFESVIAALTDSYGNLWKGTPTGLYVKTKDREHQVASLGNKTVAALHEYNGWLIAASIGNLTLINLQDFNEKGVVNSRTFTDHDGYISQDAGQNSFFRDKYDTLWFPITDKLMAIPLRKLIGDTVRFGCNPVMTFIDYSRNEREWRSIDHRGEPIIKLPRGKNSVRFHFNNRSLVSRKVEYKYKLEGFQKVWNDLPEGNSVTFADLKPGKYRLLLTGSNDGVNWHSMHHSPLIIRQPLVWEQKFFSILITAAVLGFIYLLAHYFIRRRQEAEIRALNQKKRMNELMLQTIRTKNIPHFSGNALSRIESFIFNSDFRQANKFLSLYSKLINTTLSDSDRPSRTIREEIEYVKIYMDLEKIRSDGRFDYEINVLPEVDMQVEIPNMLLHTWSENAIKHGIWESKRKGLINIQIFQESDILTVKVTDNGIGREKAREMHTQGSGNGLRIIKEQLEVYNRFNKEKAYIVVDDLKDSEGNPMGTSFSLRMPLTYQFSF